MKLRRIIAALAASLLLAVVINTTASADVTQRGTGCSTAEAQLFGSGSWYPNQHNLRICNGTNIGYMTSISSHRNLGDPLQCPDWIGQDHVHFDNCVTSLWVDFKAGAPAGLKLCLYVDENFSGAGGGLVVIGDYSTSNLSGSYNDKFSSYKWTTGSC